MLVDIGGSSNVWSWWMFLKGYSSVKNMMAINKKIGVDN